MIKTPEDALETRLNNKIGVITWDWVITSFLGIDACAVRAAAQVKKSLRMNVAPKLMMLVDKIPLLNELTPIGAIYPTGNVTEVQMKYLKYTPLLLKEYRKLVDVISWCSQDIPTRPLSCGKLMHPPAWSRRNPRIWLSSSTSPAHQTHGVVVSGIPQQLFDLDHARPDERTPTVHGLAQRPLHRVHVRRRSSLLPRRTSITFSLGKHRHRLLQPRQLMQQASGNNDSWRHGERADLGHPLTRRGGLVSQSLRVRSHDVANQPLDHLQWRPTSHASAHPDQAGRSASDLQILL